MVARFKCVLVGQLPASIDPVVASRRGIDEVVSTPPEGAVVVSLAGVSDVRSAVATGLQQAISEMIAGDSEATVLALAGWDGVDIEAIDFGLMDGAIKLPARPARYLYSPANLDT